MCPQFHSNSRVHFLKIMYLAVFLVASCHGEAKCHTYKGVFKGGIRDKTTLTVKKCILASPTVAEEKLTIDSIASLGAVTYTQDKCDQDAANWDTEILSPGCLVMGGSLNNQASCSRHHVVPDNFAIMHSKQRH
jgi:hypothetical protein